MLTNKEVLKDRFDAKLKQLEAKLATLKADTRKTAAEESERLKERIVAMRDAVREGWASISEVAASKLNSLLDRAEDDDESDLAAKDRPN